MNKKSKKQSKPTPKYDSERETRVLMEQISSDVKAIAEGHSGLDQKLNRANAKLEEHDQRFDRIEMAVMENMKAIKGNTEAIKGLKAGQDEIKEKLESVTTDHEHRLQKLETA